jgi:hypothetical protein
MVAMCRVAPHARADESLDRDRAADHGPERIEPAPAAFRRPVKLGPDKPQAELGIADLGSTMTSHVLPDAGTLVEMTASDEPVRGVRVVHAEGAVLTLSLALSVVPPVGGSVTLRWPAGARGRYAQDAVVVEIDENRVDVEATGAARIEQQRSFVRGGGGEQALLCRPGAPDTIGWIRDVSEHAVRAHFADVELRDGDEFRLRMLLDLDLVELDATAVKVASLRQTVPQRGPMSVEVVAVFAADEVQAQVIRRYVLRQQLLVRARTAG